MDRVATDCVQKTTSDAQKVAEPNTVENVGHGIMQGLKRDRESDSENQSRKKPRLSNTIAPPPQKTSNFMARIGAPGRTAAQPTVSSSGTKYLHWLIRAQNIKITQEIVKVPVPHKSRSSPKDEDGHMFETRSGQAKATSPKSSKALGMRGELPAVRKTSPGVLGKRLREDDADLVNLKKTKVC